MHGCDVARLCHEQFYALWLWRHESRIRSADRHRWGIVAADSELPIGWFFATCETRDEATVAYEKHIASLAAMRNP